MKRRLFALILALSMVLPLFAVVDVQAAQSTVEELVTQQYDAFAKGLNPGSAVDVMSRLVNHSVKSGSNLTMTETDTFAKGLLNSGLFRQAFIRIAVTGHEYFTQAKEDTLFMRGSFGWYDNDATYSFFGTYETEADTYKDIVRINGTSVSSKNYVIPMNGYDDAMVMVGGGVSGRFWFEKTKVTPEEITYRIKIKIYDDFDFNAGNYKGNDAALSNLLKYTGLMLSMGLLKTYTWTVNTSFEFTVPIECNHESNNYRWEFDGVGEMVPVTGDGLRLNTLVRKDTEGTYQDDMFSKVYYKTDHPIRLWHDKPWVLEFRSQGTGAFSFAESSTATTGLYIRKASTTVFFGETEKYKEDDKTKYYYHHYGVNTGKGTNKISSKDVHTYRLENHIAEDGSNMVYLFVDDVEFGPMNNYYLSGTDQKQVIDWVVGKDFTINYIGNNSYKLTNVHLDYVQFWENGVDNESFTYYSERTVAPTCTEQGYLKHTCSICDATYGTDYIAALGHSYGEWKQATAPTCTQQGQDQRKCATCGNVESRAVAAKGHNYTRTVTEPDCVTAGYNVDTCSTCGHVQSTQHTPALGHVPVTDAGVAPTCTQTGISDGSHCDVCDKILVRQETLAALGHTEVTDPVRFPDCTNPGSTGGSHCGICGEIFVAEVIVPAIGHVVVVQEGYSNSCTEDGMTEGRYCSVCNEVFATQEVIPALGHNPVIDEPREATCDQVGLTEGSHCSNCGEVYVAQEEIPAFGHTEVVDPMVNPTCLEQGLTKGSHCSVCGKVLLKQAGIPALGHVTVTDEAVAATCTTAGKTEGSHCAICRTVFVAQEKIPALGHTEIAEGGVEATCTESGLTDQVTCTVCQQVIAKQVVIPALGHTVVEQESIPAGCTQDGLTEGSYCEICGTVLEEQVVIPATGHGEVVDAAKAATCTEDGLTEGSHCENCGEIFLEQEIVPAFGHREVIDEAKAATCTEMGLSQGIHCETCGEVFAAQEVIPAFGHREVIDEAKTATCTENGLTAGSHCETCGTVLVEQEVILAYGHEEVEVAGKQASCSEDGLTVGIHCETCGEVLEVQKVIPAFGHTVIQVAGKSATCTEDGMTEGSYCAICDEILTAGEKIAAMGHREVTDKAKEATCTDKGLTEGSHCETCGLVLIAQKEIDASGHRIVVDLGWEPSCEEEGLSDGSHCGICELILEEQEVIPATGHDWSEEVLLPGVGPNGEDEIRWYCTCGDYIFELEEEKENPFTDVKEKDFFYDSVLWAVENEITNGMGENTFAPGTTCTRGQVVTFLWRAFGEPEPQLEENPFEDVKEGAYYYEAVLWAVEKGITKGVSDTAFGPGDPCTRGHVVTFLHRALDRPEGSEENPFGDVTSSAYYFDAVLWAVEAEVTKGTSVDSFSPLAPCTRGQIVTFLHRALN